LEPSTHSHYRHAPITEAVLDIQTSFIRPVPLELLAQVQGKVETQYPQRDTIVQGAFALALDSPGSASGSTSVVGYRFSNRDATQVFQARGNGYTFNRLAPYKDWDDFQSEARRLWNHYKEVTQPSAIVRTAVRYINRLDLPETVHDFAEYLHTLPEIAHPIDTGLSAFLMRLELPQKDIGATVILTEALVPSPIPQHVAVLLDIDVYREAQTDPATDTDLWEFFEVLRERKNRIFEACITDRMREAIS